MSPRRLAALAALLVTLAWVLLAASRASLEAPPPSLTLLDRHGELLGEVGRGDDQDLGAWPLDPVPWRVAAATLALEDRRFWTHPGVDPQAVVRAFRQNLAAGEVISGASTIAMQIARMQRPAPRTLPNKVTEALVALMLTARYDRDALLAHYLRLTPYGNRAQGVAYAARRYLDKPVADLSWAETAFLCAIPQSPSRHNPMSAEGRRRAITRAGRILDALAQDGLLRETELAQARHELQTIDVSLRHTRPSETLHAVLALERQLKWTEGMDPRVHTTLDLSVQRLAQQAAREQLNLWAPYGAGQAALVVVSLPAAEVLAAVGSVDWGEGSVAGAIDFTRTPRPPGSLLKPFAYAEALERGAIQPNTPLFDVGRARDGIHDADGRSLGPLMPRVALGNSRNVPAVALAEAVGLNALFDRFVSLGLHKGDAAAEEVGYGLVIGGLGTTALQVAEAYTALALEGQKRALSWVKDQPGEVTRIFSPQVARLVTLWLADPQARLPSFPRMGYSELPFPTAVKTGTSPQARDAWAVAWTDRHLVVAWIGHPDWRPMTAASGYRAGAALAQRVLLELESDRADGLSDTQFPAPDGWPLVKVCPLSGQAATEACGQTPQEHVAEVPEPCTMHTVEAGRVVVRPDPRWLDWAASEGLPLAQDAAPTDAEPSLTLLSPRGGERLTIDPEQPAEAATFALRVAVTPAADQVLWVIDGEPWALVEAPYAARWPLSPGVHRIRAELPWTTIRSDEVTIEVR